MPNSGENNRKLREEENNVIEALERKGQRVRIRFLKDLLIPWNWDDFLENALTCGENVNLAMAGLILSNEAEAGPRQAETALRRLGFDHIERQYYSLLAHPIKDISNPARCFGHRILLRNDRLYHVFCAVFRGTMTLSDAFTDAKSVMDGFYEGGRSCADSLKAYMKHFITADRDNTILFITGHSLGASTANVVGRLCREFAKEESTFVYTFASPNYETGGEWVNAGQYGNFRYYTNVNDLVPSVPLTLAPQFFSKIGIEHSFDYDSMDESQKERFLRVYRYLRGADFEADNDPLGTNMPLTLDLPSVRALKNHLCQTYMSFLLSEFPDQEIDPYLAE